MIHSVKGATQLRLWDATLLSRTQSVKEKEIRISDPRINDRIRATEVRLVGPEGEQVGVVRVDIALRLAQEADLDLVEVSPNSNPPVVKVMDYGKYKYEAAQKAKEARKNQANTVLKEVRFRLKIDTMTTKPSASVRNRSSKPEIKSKP